MPLDLESARGRSTGGAGAAGRRYGGTPDRWTGRFPASGPMQSGCDG